MEEINQEQHKELIELGIIELEGLEILDADEDDN